MNKTTPKIYRRTDWSSYNRALINRGNLTIWFDPDIEISLELLIRNRWTTLNWNRWTTLNWNQWTTIDDIYIHALAADGVLKDAAYVSAKIGANITDLDPNHLNYNSDANYSSYPTSGSVFGMSNSQKTLASGSVAFGWNLEPSLHVPVRTELELSAQQDHQFDGTSNTFYDYSNGTYYDHYYLKDSVKLQQQSVMWNTYFDWKNSTKFTPYFAVGVGATRIHTKGTLSWNEDWTEVGYVVVLGSKILLKLQNRHKFCMVSGCRYLLCNYSKFSS